MYKDYGTAYDSTIPVNQNETLSKIKYIVIDVDGTMTDGGIYYDDNGNEIKKFCTKDAAAFFTAKCVGIKTMVLTGRKCLAVERRMKELGVDYLCQGVTNKLEYLSNFMVENDISAEQLAYIGDDLNDFAPMKLAGFVGCPYDSCEEIKNISDYVSDVRGGNGAVRDIVAHILKKREQWNEAIKRVYRL